MKITRSLLKAVIKDEICKLKENNPFYDPIDDAIVIDQETEPAAIPDTEYESMLDKMRELQKISKHFGIVKISFLNRELDKLLNKLSEMADVMPRN
jgi:hypothetical protein